jgi:WXG100 family type VII secretion target
MKLIRMWETYIRIFIFIWGNERKKSIYMDEGGMVRMRSIYVEPEQLESCAARMDSENQDYLRALNALFETVDNLQAAWKGKDNLAYTNAISKFESDFRQLSALCTQYSDFLKSSASAYRETQDELTEQAAHIA